jgi:hypothetical protein
VPVSDSVLFGGPVEVARRRRVHLEEVAVDEHETAVFYTDTHCQIGGGHCRIDADTASIDIFLQKNIEEILGK